MRFPHAFLLLPAAIGVLFGCAVPTPEEPARPQSKLTIYDIAENLLASEDIPIQGGNPLNVVMREGRYEDLQGIFVQMNGTVRFVPWLDLTTDPRGQRIYSDAFRRAGELTLRVTKAPCGGRLPLTFQIRELRPKALQGVSAGPQTISEIKYEPLSGWTESGIYLPDRFIDRIDGRWADQDCQPSLSADNGLYAQRPKPQKLTVRYAGANEGASPQAVLESYTAAKTAQAKIAQEPAPKKRSLRRDSDDHGDNDHSGGNHRDGGSHM